MVKVDAEKCIGCGTCVAVCSDAFAMDDDTHKAVAKDGAEDVSCVDEGIDACPVEAITKE